MMSPCASTPAWVWNSPPSARVIRWRRRFASTSNARSPAANARAISAHHRRGHRGLHRELDRAHLRTQTAERADGAGSGRSAHGALPQFVAFVLGVAGEALVPALE